MALPWLSVVIPAYHGQAFLEAALQSILRQRAGDAIEFIAVDDGSCDETRAILTGYSRRLPIRIERLPHSGNWVIGTNVGLSLAPGKYACFLHQEDRWCENRLLKMRRLADQHPEVPLLIHPSWYVDAGGSRVGRLSCPVRDNGGLVDAAELVHGLLIQCFLTTCAPVFRTDVVRETGDLDETLWYSADWEFWLRLAGVAGAVLHPEPLCEFRLHRASQTSVRAIDEADLRSQHDRVLSRYIPKLPARPDSAKTEQMARFSAAVNVGLTAVRTQRYGHLPGLLSDVSALGLVGVSRYLRYSRLMERTLSRIRAGVAWPGQRDTVSESLMDAPREKSWLASLSQSLGLFVGACAFWLSGCGSDHMEPSHVVTVASPNSATASTAETVVCSDPVWDFGTVDAKDFPTLEHSFRLLNRSQQVVTVAGVKPSCGCIVAADHPTTIAPGGDAAFDFQVRVAGSPGRFSKAIVIEVDQPIRSAVQLVIQGMIRTDASFYSTPAVVDFGRIPVSEKKQRKVRLSRYDGGPVEIHEVETSELPVIVTGMTPLDDGRSIVELTIEYDAAKSDLGRSTFDLTGHARGLDRKQFRIPVRAHVTAPLPDIAETLFIPQVVPGGSASRPLFLVGSADLPVPLSRFQGPEILSVRITPAELGPRVEVSVSADFQMTSSQQLIQGRLRLSFDRPACEIAVPLRVMVRKAVESGSVANGTADVSFTD